MTLYMADYNDASFMRYYILYMMYCMHDNYIIIVHAVHRTKIVCNNNYCLELTCTMSYWLHAWHGDHFQSSRATLICDYCTKCSTSWSLHCCSTSNKQAKKWTSDLKCMWKTWQTWETIMRNMKHEKSLGEDHIYHTTGPTAKLNYHQYFWLWYGINWLLTLLTC